MAVVTRMTITANNSAIVSDVSSLRSCTVTASFLLDTRRREESEKLYRAYERMHAIHG